MRETALARALERFARDEGGANAVEFSILAVPFIMLVLFCLQISILAMTKMSLDTGVLKCREDLQSRFSSSSPPSLPSGAAIKQKVADSSGGMVANTSSLAVEVRQLSTLSSGSTPISDGSTDYGSAYSVLAIRASYVTPSYVPGLPALLTSYSSSIVRRQSQ